MKLNTWRLFFPIIGGNFDCKVDLTLSVLQILYKGMHLLERQDSINHYCNIKLLLQNEINVVSA